MVVIIGIILIVVYLILIITYVSGWKRTAFYKVNKAVNDTISVVIACKNEADNLSALFHSLMNQSYTNYEIIFVNDNSTDNTLNVLSEFSKKHPHCKVYPFRLSIGQRQYKRYSNHVRRQTVDEVSERLA